MMIYHSIVFMQGDEATEPLEILDNKGAKAAIDYLAQWDYGTEMEHSPVTEPPWGDSDHTEKRGSYVLSYNTHLGYIGLVRTARVNQKEFEAEREAHKAALRSRKMTSDY